MSLGRAPLPAVALAAWLAVRMRRGVGLDIVDNESREQRRRRARLPLKLLS